MKSAFRGLAVQPLRCLPSLLHAPIHAAAGPFTHPFLSSLDRVPDLHGCCNVISKHIIFQFWKPQVQNGGSLGQKSGIQGTPFLSFTSLSFSQNLASHFVSKHVAPLPDIALLKKMGIKSCTVSVSANRAHTGCFLSTHLILSDVGKHLEVQRLHSP